MVDLSIIIVSYNTKKITKKCVDTAIQSLNFDKTLQAEIIIIDNNSNDGSKEVFKKMTGIKFNNNVNLKLIINEKNLGFARANNIGAKKSEGNYLLFLNSDIEVINDAIPKLFDFYRSNETKYQFVGAKLLNKDLTSQPSCGPFYSLPVVFGALFLKGDYWGLTRYSPNKTKRVDWVSGACFITKKKYFNRLGGFDENIFMYMEEIDLFYRAKKLGFKVGFCPKAKFIHLGSASSTGRTQPIIQVFKGLTYFYQKHYSSLDQKILKIMLKLKAQISIFLGKITKNHYLTETYGKALATIEEN